jgi:hypothetical protein
VRATQEAEMKTVEHHETPDIEVAADQYEEEQNVLRELAQEDDGLEDARGISECMAECAKREAAEARPYCPKCDRQIDPEDEMSGGNCRRCGEPLEYDMYAGINSCDALRILDGVA